MTEARFGGITPARQMAAVLFRLVPLGLIAAAAEGEGCEFKFLVLTSPCGKAARRIGRAENGGN